MSKERGVNHRIEEPFAGAWDEPPWPLAIELARRLPNPSWSLIGGLMVRMHSIIAGLDHARSTVDVDVLYLEPNGVGYSQLASLLSSAGFVLIKNTTFAYRFVREDENGTSDIVDLLISQGAEEQDPRTFTGRKLLVAPGGVRAAMETESVSMMRDGLEIANLNVPSLRAAMILKGAAFQLDNRDRMRHLEDGVMLLASIPKVEELDLGLSLRSRKRIRILLRGVKNHPEVWLNHNPTVRGIARRRLEQLSSLFDVEGTDNSRSL